MPYQRIGSVFTYGSDSWSRPSEMSRNMIWCRLYLALSSQISLVFIFPECPLSMWFAHNLPTDPIEKRGIYHKVFYSSSAMSLGGGSWALFNKSSSNPWRDRATVEMNRGGEAWGAESRLDVINVAQRDDSTATWSSRNCLFNLIDADRFCCSPVCFWTAMLSMHCAIFITAP